MTPYVSGEQEQSLQNPGTIKYKDMYPPGNVELYYAVTVVDGEGQEEKAVGAKKVFENIDDPLPGFFAKFSVRRSQEGITQHHVY